MRWIVLFLYGGWGRSTRKAVEKAISITDGFHGKLLGGVLNKVDTAQMVYYSGYYDAGYPGSQMIPRFANLLKTSARIEISSGDR